MPAVVFDAAAIADFQEHFDVVFGAREQALRFEKFSVATQLHDAFFKLFLDGLNGAMHAILGHDVVHGGIDENLIFAFEQLAG
jgi:hypothetical protein